MIDCKKDIAEGCETLQVKFERMDRAPFGLVRIHSFASLLKRTQAALSELHEKAEHCAALYDKARKELECETKARLFLLDQNKELKRQLVEMQEYYASAVSRWAGLAKLWAQEHGGNVIYFAEKDGAGLEDGPEGMRNENDG